MTADSDNPEMVDDDEHEKDIDFEARVGYGQPPRHSRWSKGMRSPNPSGRPRKNQTRRYYLEQICSREIRFKDGDRVRTGTVLEAIILIVKAKEISGSQAASRLGDKLRGIARIDEDEPIAKGVLFAPEQLTDEEWIAKHSP